MHTTASMLIDEQCLCLEVKTRTERAKPRDHRLTHGVKSMDLAAVARPAQHMTLGGGTAKAPDPPLAELQGNSPEPSWLAQPSLMVVAGAIVIVWAAALFVTPRAHILIESRSLNSANAAAIF